MSQDDPDRVTMPTPAGPLHLERRPPAGRQPLRAWDGADRYLLDRLGERAAGGSTPGHGHVLVVNDAFGALTVALERSRPAGVEGSTTFLTDSAVSALAMRDNCRRNQVDPSGVAVQDGPEALRQTGDRFDVVLVRVPRSTALLEHQLRLVRSVVDADTVILAGVMSKYLRASTVECFERILGPTAVSPASRRARLLTSTLDPSMQPGPSPWPVEYRLPDGVVAVNHPGVHAAGRMDPGTRFFLEHLPRVEPGARVVDLGCGDGIVGLTVARAEPTAQVTLVDESPLALASAEATFDRNGARPAGVRFVLADVFEVVRGDPIAPGSADLVLVNPPFHADHAVGDLTAWEMFRQTRQVLVPGGELWVVGNRHLGHHRKLARLFGASDVVASSPKFVVSRAVR